MTSLLALPADLQLADDIMRFYDDPLGFVRFAFPWGEENTELRDEPGPDANQIQFLIDLGAEVKKRRFNGHDPVMPILMAASSGHGTGKSVLGAWLTDWILSTRPHSIGTVTANTYPQLESRTWAQVQRWTRMCITGHWFNIRAQGIYAKAAPESWKVVAQTCKEEAAQSFAGQHARTSTSWYMFDEACHDDQTEVLTRDGWIPFDRLTLADDLLSMNPETHVAEYVRPVALHASHYEGSLCTYERRGCNFRVTPKHRMYLRQINGHTREYMPWRFQEAGELLEKTANIYMSREIRWCVEDRKTFTIPGFQALIKAHPERTVDFDKWVQFLGWYYAEGNLLKRKNSLGDIEYIGTGITNQDLCEPTMAADAMGFDVCSYPDCSTSQIRIHDRALSEHLASFGVGTFGKRIPDYVMQASARQINIFLDAYVKGDGYRRGSGRDIIYTSSKILADQLQELCLKGGANSTIRKRQIQGQIKDFGTHTATSSCDGYVVSRARANQSINVLTSQLQSTPYSGMVYCAELPKYHLLYTRRDGTCMWSGNSHIPDGIWDVASGGLTDGEPMMFAWGQPAKKSGRFYEICFGRFRDRWNVRCIDSRNSRFTNKQLIEEWIKDYGEDHDFIRVRVMGLAPRAGDLQFIDQDRVDAAKRRTPQVFPDDPLVAGFDVSGGGQAWNIVWFRRGADARSIPPICIPGEHSQERSAILARLAEVCGDRRPGRRLSMLFVDSAFGAPYVERLKSMGYDNVQEINFGGPSPDRHQANMRAHMWHRMKEWLALSGSIPADDVVLETDLTAPGSHLNRRDQLVLESKEDMQKRGIASPDRGDALALTFAAHVPPIAAEEPQERYGGGAGSWMG